ncbi:hypothetical protein CUJ88_13065 [Paraburkholderia hospita]|nr:hypothetical protein CUJ88_13065 [Paraburkholderia hospita]OUL80336.1 hypothetical protein CA603_32085 [Paraburkholderia hospita]OUL83590.1 hypothetical protein CA601_27490 [Paraburkholderia hospita]OUL83923.1 hypothetical protein CA602_21010 [Paraburkholderia hospita]
MHCHRRDGVTSVDLPVCKIGRTARDPVVRCAEINQSSTGDFLWEVTHHIGVNDCRKFESLVHAKLLQLRQKKREFFNIHPDDAIVAIQSILWSAPDLRIVTIAESQKEDSGVSRRTGPPRKQSARQSRDTIYAHLLDGFTELLKIKRRPFGQLNKPAYGVSDGREGVQWNLKIYPDVGTARVGVNLEGMKYSGWPIASLIRSELEVPALLRLVPHLRDPENIILRFARDAWLATSRPDIVEQLLGEREFRLSELTEEIWHTILSEAIRCLNEDRSYRGRGRQAVTLLRKAGPDAESRMMPVTPHLTIWAPIDPERDLTEDLSAAIERLAPVHEWASKASGA